MRTLSEKLFPYQVITYNKDHKKAKTGFYNS